MAGVSSCVSSYVSSSVLEGGGGAALTTGQAETGSIQAGTERLERLRVTWRPRSDLQPSRETADTGTHFTTVYSTPLNDTDIAME